MNNYSSSAMKRFNHLLGEINGAYHEIALKLEMSDSAMAVLYTVCDSGDSCLLQDICRCSGLSKQTINSAIRALEAKGAVYLEAAGPRSKRVCLTEAGKALAGRTAGRVIQAENEIFAAWPQEDVEKYLELTERYLYAIREKADQL